MIQPLLPSNYAMASSSLKTAAQSKSSKDIFHIKYQNILAFTVFVGLITAVFFSGKKLRHQLQWQASFLEDELVVEMHEFGQLRRETLRLNRSLIPSSPPEQAAIDLEKLQLHTDLVQSRITIIEKSKKQHRVFEGEIANSIDEVIQSWADIKQQITLLQQLSEAAPEKRDLQQSILTQLEQLEIKINQLSLINNKERWYEYKTLVQSQQQVFNVLIVLITSFFLSATLFTFYALRFARTRQQLLEKLAKTSITDDLTQIANRRQFNNVIEREWKRSLRNQAQVALMLCDIDYFKRYNDHYGHQAGDKCLQQVARILNQSAHRSSDFVARYGGEEFVVILPTTSVQAAMKFAARLHTKVAQANIEHAASEVSAYITLSIGIAVGVPTPNLRPETALRFADEALYEAKRSGRNQSAHRVFNLTKLQQWPQKVAEIR